MKANAPDSFLDRLPFIVVVAISIVWTAFVVLYLRDLPGGWTALTPAEAAGLFAGAGGPLAALWLFLAVVEQRRRLSLMTHAMGEMLAQHRHSLQLAETQTRALVEFQAQAKRLQSADTRQMALQDLAASVAFLAERLGVIRRDDMDMTWARFGSGDMTAFVQPFLNFTIAHPDMGERLADAAAADPLVATALQSFVRRYERLTSASADDKLTQEIIDEGPLGRTYRIFKMASGTAPQGPAFASAPPPLPQAVPVGSDEEVTAGKAAKSQADLFNGDPLQAKLAELSERLDAAAPH